MIKLNNKGMTLMELLVSVVLISIIMIFMYKLISDVRSDKRDNDKITDNILKISEIQVESLNEITSDISFEKNEISKVSLSKSTLTNSTYVTIDIIKTNGNHLIYSIGFKKSSSYEVQIKKENNIKRKWTLSEDIKNIKIEKNCNYTSKQLVCEIDFNLFDANNDLVDTIVYPLYFHTAAFTDEIDNLDQYNNK